LSLFRSAAELPVGTVDMGTSPFTTTLVHGAAASPMVAERPSVTLPEELVRRVEAQRPHVAA
jgi:hypothetical protein